MKRYTLSLITTLMSFAALLLSACATSSALSTSGNQYSATKPESIQVLTQYPSNYQSVGLVEASAPKGYLRKPKHATKNALAALKKQAASMGAQAVVLKDYSSSQVPDFSLGDGDEFGLIFTSERKHVTAEAIRF